jgi:hypothetical protein
LELLLFDRGKVSPDGGAISVVVLTDFFEDGGYVLSNFAIGFGDGGADEPKAFVVRGGVELYGRSGLLFGV